MPGDLELILHAKLSIIKEKNCLVFNGRFYSKQHGFTMAALGIKFRLLNCWSKTPVSESVNDYLADAPTKPGAF